MPRLWTLFWFLAPLLAIYLASKSSHAWPYNPLWFLATHPDIATNPDSPVAEFRAQQPFYKPGEPNNHAGQPIAHVEPSVADENSFVRKIVAVGDLHGDMGNARKVLKLAGVVDDNGDWTGDVDYFVQTGDIIDR